MRLIILLMMNLFWPGQILAANPRLEIFDGHIHYSSDVWDKLSPQRALELLTEAGKLTSVWHQLMTDFPSRFVTGMDTETGPSR